VTPADVGLPGGGRRRTPGLRREEVAQLAGSDYPRTAPTSHPELRLAVHAPADEQSRTALARFVAEVGARG
jgi:hypothetical protein